VLFGSGSHDNSVCPSLACLDIKMYNFLNSEACICTVQDLKSIRDLSSAAQGHLNITLIGDSPNIIPSMFDEMSRIEGWGYPITYASPFLTHPRM
jgi:hypothetical protein